MSRPLTPSEECALTFPPRSFEYMECLKTKISNPYEIGYEITPKMSIGTILGIISAIVIIILIYLSVKAKVNPFDLILSFFR